MSAAVSFGAPREREPADRRFRIRALPAGADWRALLALSPPANDRPSGIALRTPAGRDLPPEHVAAIDHAVRVEGGGLTPERRFDLRQDLSIKLLTYRGKPIANVKAWCVTCARNLLASEQRDEGNRRRILKEAHELGAPRGYSRKGSHASEQTMHVKRTVTFRDVEGPLVEMIDERTERGIGRPRTPTCPQTLIVEAAIQEKRTSVKKYAGSTPFRASLPERSNMTPNFEGAK